MTYRADIDGLRAVAVLAVVAYHAFPGVVRGGFVGVDVFFVISGFLITGIILEALRKDRFTFAEFYARRIRRIFPALAVVLSATFAAGWFLLFSDDLAALSRHIVAGAAFVANFALWNESGYFDSAAETKPLLHLWSLGIEEQFYLVWPALLVLAWRKKIHPLWVSVALMGASFLFGVWTVRIDPVEAFYSPVTRLWELLLGGALASLGGVRLRGAQAEAGAGVGLALIVAAVVVLDHDRLFPGLWALLPTVGALLLLASGPGATVNRVILAHPALVWVGLISYPLYLWHWPLLSFARIAYADTPPTAVRTALVAASVALAWGTFVLLEKPVRHGAARRWAVPVLSVAMVAVAAIGVAGDRTGGFVERAINRSDTAHFLQYYDRLHRRGLGAAYRQECDFMQWGAETVRDAIDPSCTAAGSRQTLFLWGDSYAQSLSHGIRSLLPGDTRLAQVATSGCRPSFDDVDPQVPGGRCRRANAFAVDQIRALRPEVVIVAQQARHGDTDWQEMAGRLLDLGARRVALVGPAPQWRPSLPDVVVSQHWGRPFDRVSYGLDAEAIEADRVLRASLAGSPRLTYVSLIGGLCTDEGCVAMVPGTADLVAVDAGHLSPSGSIFVAQQVLAPALGLR